MAKNPLVAHKEASAQLFFDDFDVVSLFYLDTKKPQKVDRQLILNLERRDR
jgi:hypothetical protein